MSKFGCHVLQVWSPLKEAWARVNGFGLGGISRECHGWVNSDSQVNGDKLGASLHWSRQVEEE